MNKSEDGLQRNNFVLGVLPWVVAGGALLVYLATLNTWVSFNSLQSVAKLSGWTWRPELTGPLYWALTLPLRLLPASAIPVGANLFSTLCAILTLALLARSVALLPHDRTQEQRDREKSEFSLLSLPAAWLPPVLAVVVLGLQLTFWEDATSASGHLPDLVATPSANQCEMLDLLLFAYVIRCLLEYRAGVNQSWLTRAAFVYGLGMTGNWAMTGLLPLFVIALIRVKGLSFFNSSFLVRMTLWGLAGLSLLLLLPIAQSLADIARVPFWHGFIGELGYQKATLLSAHAFVTQAKDQALLLAVTSLVPIFLISLRWSPSFGDNSRVGIWLTTFTFQAVQAVFLAICVWVALDPKLSPRNTGFGVPCFTLFYLGALSVGYFAGYFLLVHGRGPRSDRKPLPPTLLNRGVVCAVWLLLPLLAAAFIWRNLPQVRLTNGPLLKDYAARQAQTLPPRGAILLSDHPEQLVLLHAYLASQGRSGDFTFVDTTSLQTPEYHRFLKKHYPSRWPVDMPRDAQQLISPATLVRVVLALTASNQVYYLHPSFGYYFEVFDALPHGLVYKLSVCHTNSLLALSVSPELFQENEAFWAAADKATLNTLAAALAPASRPASTSWLDKLAKRAYLSPIQNRDASVLGGLYSRALDYWGVQAQTSGHLTAAAAHFQRALDLNPGNLAAETNLECNHGLQANHRLAQIPDKPVEDLLGPYRSWERLLGQTGPFDDPLYCQQFGLDLAKNRLFRQAARQFSQAKALVVDDPLPSLWLARMDILRSLPDEALRVLKEVHDHAAKVELARTNASDLMVVDMAAYLTKGDTKGAEGAVRWALAKYPADETLLPTATRVYLSYGVASNAVPWIRGALAQHPDDENLLVMACQVYTRAKLYTDAAQAINTAITRHTAEDPVKQFMLATAADVQINAGSFSNAVIWLDRQLKLNPANPQALIAKGYAFLQLGSLDQAVGVFTEAIDMETNNSPDFRTYARLNRAVTYLRSGKLDLAQRDYEVLKTTYPSAYPVYYGLQEIAYRKKDTNAAVRYCQQYLTTAPTNTPESKQIRARLAELRPPPH